MDPNRQPIEQVAAMPLHAITEMLGTDGLLQRFSYEVSKFSEQEQHQLNQAFLIANHLHQEDQRVREPYINHILRVATRMMTHYGIRDVDAITAAILHDVVEDHSDDKLFGQASAEDQQANALNKLGEWINPRVANFVSGVTNPKFNPETKNEEYLEHLKHLVAAQEPWILVIKLSDFTDNATGLMYTTGPKVKKSAVKYLPAIPIFLEALKRPDLPLAPEVIEHIKGQLELTQDRLAPMAA